MGNAINKDLRELRMAKEHYERVLKEDDYIKRNVSNLEDYLLLSDEDISKIKTKIDIINIKIDELLIVDNGYEDL